MARVVLVVAALGTLAACATAYQAQGLTGGYKEEPAGRNRWYVQFFGNGHTTRDTVLVYWLHRCAELTELKGFDHFILVSRKPPAGVSSRHDEPPVAPSPDDAAAFIPASGGKRYGSLYIPATTITTWSAGGVIELRNGPPEWEERRPYFEAKALLTRLRPLVRDASEQGLNVQLPPNLLPDPENQDSADRAGSGPVRLEDLDGLLPKD